MRQLPLHNSSAILGTILAIFLPFIFCNEPSSVQAATSNIDATVQIQTTRQQQPVPSATATNQQNLGLATSQAKTSLSTTAPRSAPLTDNQSADIAISTDTSPIKTTNTTQSTQQIVQTTTPDHPSTTTTDTPPDDVTTDQSQPSPSTDTPETIIPGKTPNSAIATKPDGNDPEQVETQPADTTPTTTTKADEEVINDQINHSQTTSNSANTTTISPSSQNNSLTTSSVNQSTDQTIHPTINGIISNLITDITSFSGAAVVYPFVFTRVAQLMSDFRTLLSPDRYNIDQMWTGLDDKYNPEYSKTFYTEAKDWYDNQVPKETWSVPFYDDTSKSARATYIKNNDSTSTVIYGQGWTTDPDWMGYISKVFYDMGYNVLITYTRGQNTSDGNFITYGAKDKYDWQEWIKKVDAENGPNSKVILYGQSMGADTALEAASVPGLSTSVKAVIADCGYSTMPSLAYSIYQDAAKTLNDLTSMVGINLNGQIPLLPFNKVLTSLSAINHFFQGNTVDDISGITAVKNSKVPTLFISTTDDGFIPSTQTTALYNNSAASLKELWLLDGNVGGHASANNAVLAYQQHIRDFVAKAEGQSEPLDQLAAA